eukprot:6613119-Prymnesium_polylepis.1
MSSSAAIPSVSAASSTVEDLLLTYEEAKLTERDLVDIASGTPSWEIEDNLGRWQRGVVVKVKSFSFFPVSCADDTHARCADTSETHDARVLDASGYSTPGYLRLFGARRQRGARQ